MDSLTLNKIFPPVLWDYLHFAGSSMDSAGGEPYWIAAPTIYARMEHQMERRKCQLPGEEQLRRSVSSRSAEEIRVRNKTPETPARSESFAGQGHCKTLGHRRGYNRTLFTVAFGRGIGSAAIAKLQNTSHE